MPFRSPTRTFLEPGCLVRLPEVAAELSAQRLLLVVDPGLAATPWPERARGSLLEVGLAVETFQEVEANPRAETVERIASAVSAFEADGVVGLGGGSVLDAAKAAAMLATNPGRLVDFEGRNRFSRPALPFIAIPTTCGTGSEVTWVSVITVPERRAKVSVKGDGMYPRVALVDAELLASLPGRLVAWTGADALTHALEATTGLVSNPASDALAAEAIELLWRYLPRAARDIAGDGEARRAVATASTLAGLAFGSADVAAVHCLSETLGGLYDLPHGLTNAVLLSPVLASHDKAVEARLAELAERLDLVGEARSRRAAARRFLACLGEWLEDLEIPDFTALEVPEQDFDEIARRSAANGSNGSNPRPMGPAEYRQILERLAR
ncbi:MAG: iron-containing alcohol dehydrogenase [Thermoanaerobaculia bacterium]